MQPDNSGAPWRPKLQDSTDRCKSNKRVVLDERLKEWVYEIHFASSCKEAKTFVSNHRFDLVLGEFGLRDELLAGGCRPSRMVNYVGLSGDATQ